MAIRFSIPYEGSDPSHRMRFSIFKQLMGFAKIPHKVPPPNVKRTVTICRVDEIVNNKKTDTLLEGYSVRHPCDDDNIIVGARMALRAALDNMNLSAESKQQVWEKFVKRVANGQGKTTEIGNH